MTDLSRHNGADRDFYMQLGRLEAQVTSHEEKLEEIDKKLDQLLESSNKLKGGWTLLTALLSAAMFVGGFSHEILGAIKRFFAG